VIDGVTQTRGQRDRAIGDFSGQTADVTFSRVYAMARGAHTFRATRHLSERCRLLHDLLTVYELPKGKHEND